MAKRRMFSMDVIDTDYFLEMPMSSQLLYFHLALRADDDGFISSPKRILRLTGASDDDLKLLLSKEFVIPFESGICVIKHWKIHNYIRSDRYNETIYQDEKALLLEENNVYKIKDKSGIPDDIPSDIPNVSTGKVRLGKVRLGKDRREEEAPTINYQQIIDLYHNYCSSLPKVVKLSEKRKKYIHALLQSFSVDEVEGAFKKAGGSDFLTGVEGGWRADFEWLVNKNNILKVIEGRYDNRQKGREGYALSIEGYGTL
jgi:hypothetical protein